MFDVFKQSLVFPPRLFAAAKIVKPKRKRQLTEKQRERLAKVGAKTRLKPGTPSDFPSAGGTLLGSDDILAV